MKKFLFLSLLIIVVGCKKDEKKSTEPTQPELKKVVLFEIFTNTGCIPCKTAHLELDSLKHKYPDNIVFINYHVNTPDPNDPFFKEELNKRIEFYGLPSPLPVPYLVFGGTVFNEGTGNKDNWESQFLNLAQEEEKGILNLNAKIKNDSIQVGVKIKNVSGKVIAVLKEMSIKFSAPNGLTEFSDVFRMFLIDTFMNDGDSIYIRKRIDTSYVYENLKITLFVQNKGTKEVYITRDFDVELVNDTIPQLPFNLSSDSTFYKRKGDNFPVVVHFSLQTDNPGDFYVKKVEKSLPSSWFTNLCYGGVCFPPDCTRIIISFRSPGIDSFTLDVFDDNQTVSDTAIIDVFAYPVDDTLKKDKINITVIRIP